MSKAINIFIILLFCFANPASAQLKYLVEDFEGFADGTSGADEKQNGVFTYGNIKLAIDCKMTTQQGYSGQRCIRLFKEGKENYGGWGKGISMNIELDPNQDFFNFYVYHQLGDGNSSNIKIELQEDDNKDGIYEKESDDSWAYTQQLENKNSWELISIPLSKFTHEDGGGDGAFNISYKQGKLLCFIISFLNPTTEVNNQSWYFDFICFSKGKLPLGSELFNPPLAASDDLCSLGAWSAEGNKADFLGIATDFEKLFKNESQKKLAVVHFFQPFTVEGNKNQNHISFVEKINKLIQQGYIPMITLEDHFANANKKKKQPDLNSIIAGHFDSFFKEWAKEIKQIDGAVLVRILHEFNGDWYPWCIVNNDRDPALLIKAFRHIHDIFKEEQVTNAKFIWCPNSTSFPQTEWNFIMDAYPGDEFVDYVGLDVYNGAGQKLSVWRSFRKEAIENYFTLTQQLPNKSLFICETASRERKGSEALSAQSKAEWIRQMSETLKTDMSKIKLLNWFNEKESFKINSSSDAQNAFFNYILKDDYFKSGTNYINSLLQH